MAAMQTQDVRVLVVDDDEFSLNVTCKYLNAAGVKTRPVSSGVIALKAVENGKYDLVFIDHMMPEMDGTETMKRIRALGGRFEAMVLIALTGIEDENARDMFISQGFSDYVAKPVNMDSLCEILMKYLPPEKIISSAAPSGPENKNKPADLKLIATFVKEKRNVYSEIANSLSSGDIKTAHIAAHSLKTAAGYVGRKELQAAAFSLETSLGKNEHTPEQLAALEKELKAALDELEPLLAETQTQKTAQISDEDLAVILNELKPLLKASDFGAAAYAEKLAGVPGMEKLAELIENYEFDDALALISD
jgi:CheY-like chemotaxis protein